MNWTNLLGWNKTQINDLRALAYSYIQQGVYSKALTIYKVLPIVEPNQPLDLHALGALYLQLGDGMRALDCLDQTLKLDPTYLRAKLNRAKTLFMLGYRRQGVAQAKEIENAPDPLIANQAKALLLAYQQPLSGL